MGGIVKTKDGCSGPKASHSTTLRQTSHREGHGGALTSERRGMPPHMSYNRKARRSLQERHVPDLEEGATRSQRTPRGRAWGFRPKRRAKSTTPTASLASGQQLLARRPFSPKILASSQASPSRTGFWDPPRLFGLVAEMVPRMILRLVALHVHVVLVARTFQQPAEAHAVTSTTHHANPPHLDSLAIPPLSEAARSSCSAQDIAISRRTSPTAAGTSSGRPTMISSIQQANATA